MTLRDIFQFLLSLSAIIGKDAYFYSLAYMTA